MLQLLWPTKGKPDPKLLGTLGRVLHWVLTAYAVVVLILALFNLHTADLLKDSTGLFVLDGTPSTEAPAEAQAWHQRQGDKQFFHAFVAFVAGRISRYFLSAE